MPPLITHLAKGYFPIAGGIENVTQSFCEALLKEKLKVRVVSFSEQEAKDSFVCEDVNGVEVLRVRPFARIYSQPLSLSYFSQTARALRESTEVHVHWPNLVAFAALFVSSLLGRFSNKPLAKIVIYWHGDAVRQRKFRFLFAPLVRWAIRASTRIIVPARSYVTVTDFKEELQKKELFEVPLVVTENFEKALEKAGGAKIIPYTGGTFRICALGRFVWLKGFQDLVAAAEFLDGDFEMNIVGSDDDYLESLRQQVQKSPHASRIRLIVNVGLEEILDQLRSCHLYVMPSRQEMAGIVQLEAMLCGKAVITTDVPRSAVNYFNEREVTGLLVPTANPKALAAAIEELRKNPEKLQKLSESALKKAQANFGTKTFTKAVQDYTKLYGL